MSAPQRHNDRIKIDSTYDTPVSTILNLPRKRDRYLFRKSFIHSAAILFVFVCGACAVLVYRILEPFLHSILWSILIGAILFPLKHRFCSTARRHLRQLDQKSHLLCYGLIIILPIKFLDKIIESIGPLCIRKWKQLILIIIFLPSIEFLQSGVVYRCITKIGYDYFVIFERHIHIFDSLWMQTVILTYFLAVLTLYSSSSVIKYILKICSIPVWLSLLIYLSKFLPINYRVIVVTLVIVLLSIGFVIAESDYSQVNQHRKSLCTDLFEPIRAYFRREVSSPTVPSSSSLSAPYFSSVLWLLVAIKVYQFSWYLIPISIFIIIYKIIKSFLIYTYGYLNNQIRLKKIIQNIKQYCETRCDVLKPLPLQRISRFLIKGDKKINHCLQEWIDCLVSACIIIILFICVLFGTILLGIQIHHESINMIKLTSNLVNEKLILQRIVPEKEYMNDLMDKFYSFGRNWITIQVAKVQPVRVEPKCCLPLNVIQDESSFVYANTFGPSSLSNKNLEEQVLRLWDRLYTYITNTSIQNNPNKLPYSSSNQSFHLSNLFSYIQTNFDFHTNDLYRLIRDNMDLLRSILDSIWLNMSFILTIFSTILSLLFTGGFALLNFIISFMVFITLLFYLLSYSDQPIYQPTVWLNNILAIGGTGLGKAVNDAVTSVFIASLKIATFYGLYTYILHTLFGSNFVFLPAVIASICAVMLKSYWAALPGCLDLWLVQQRPLNAVILLIAQIIPVYIVDTAIYSEVKGGGHQYLTALAIAGGVYYGGIEGALIGPIILCCLLVGIRMYNETISTNLSPDPDQSPFSLRNLRERFSSLEPLVTKN